MNNGRGGSSHYSQRDSAHRVAEGRVPPYDQQAEAACIGAVLLNNEAFNILQTILSGSEDFYVEAYRRIYEAIVSLQSSYAPVDHVTLGDELKKRGDLEKVGGGMALANLTDAVASIANVEHYAKIVRDKALTRRMIYTAQEIVATGFTDIGEGTSDYLAESRRAITLASATGSNDGPVKIGSAIIPVFKDLEEGKMPDNLVRTGIHEIDDLVGGAWPGILTAIGARPGMGKSALCLNICTNAAIQDRHVLYVPTEDDTRYQVLRALARFADVDLNNLMLREVPNDAWPRLIQGANQISKLPLWVDDTPGLSSERIAQVAALHKQVHGLDLLVVDHLGELTDKGNSPTEITENAAKGLRDIAKELDIPVILATQLNREVERRQDKRPTLHDLRQSGAIEQVARVVWFLYRRGYYHQDCEDDPDTQLIVSKSSHGKTGMIKLWSDLSRMFIRAWDIYTDGPFPEEGSGKYEQPHQMYAQTQKQNDMQKGFFNNTGPPSQVAERNGKGSGPAEY